VSDILLRPASVSDTSDIAVLANIASHGLLGDVWGRSKDATGTYSPIEVGRLSVLRDGDDFNWRNATMAESNGEIVGLLLGSRDPDPPEPPPADLPPFLVPFFGLRAHAPGAWYINFLSVHVRWRKRGIGERLLHAAEAKRRETGAHALSLVVEDVNAGARRLYERAGFSVRVKTPMVRFPGGGPKGEDWLLMVRE
jgi:ribosomal protein S18 acetylase RimI-like enzyme